MTEDHELTIEDDGLETMPHCSCGWGGHRHEVLVPDDYAKAEREWENHCDQVFEAATEEASGVTAQNHRSVSDYIDERLDAMVASGELQIVGTTADGKPIYQGIPAPAEGATP